MVCDLLERLIPTFHGANLKTFTSEQSAQDPADTRVIVTDKDAVTHAELRTEGGLMVRYEWAGRSSLH